MKQTFLPAIGLVLACALVLGACHRKKPDAPPVLTAKGDTVVSSSGLRYVDRIIGTGEAPVARGTVTVHYTGTLPDGRVFDSSRESNQPLQFTLGVGEVIRGWDEGIASMRVGGRRILIVPPALAYGERAVNAMIGPNATLIFDVELLAVGK